jgi:Ran GTPase-activating protein (RanGAP) involved in mRNA processing and transport/predicted  nucleic acid-binding Zn-ribbon protein
VNTATALSKLLMDQTQIHTLDLHENVIRDKGVMTLVDAFMSAAETSKKQRLIRSYTPTSTSTPSPNHLDSMRPSPLSIVIQKCNITYLNVGSNDIGKKGLDCISEWLSHESCKLRTLILGSEKDELYTNKMDSDSASKLAKCLRRNSTLTCLDLNRNDDIGKKTQDAFYDFADTFSNRHMSNHHHNGSQNTTSASDATSPSNSSTTGSISARASSSFNLVNDFCNCNIQMLRLGDVRMNNTSAINIIQSFEGNEQLRYLDLRGNNLSYQVAEALSRLLSSGQSELYNDSSNNTTTGDSYFNHKNDPSSDSAMRDSWTCKLSTLLLHRNKLKNRGVQILSAALKYNHSLCVLNLSENNVGNEAAIALGEYLREVHTITYLDLSHNQITDEGCMVLADAIVHNPVLSHLNLSSNKLGNMGANALAKCLIQHDLVQDEDTGDSSDVKLIATKARSNIINLNLNNCGVGDEGAVSICVALSCNDNLLTLGLRNNHLTEEQTGKIMAEVLKFKRNETILYIDVRGNQIEHPTMLDIQRSLKRNKVNRSLIHPNKLRKKLIQLKYTEHLLTEARESLKWHKTQREDAEDRVDQAHLLAQKMLDEYKDLENDYMAQCEMETSLIQTIQSRMKVKEDEVLAQIAEQENRLNGLRQIMETELNNKKDVEDRLAEAEQDTVTARSRGIAEINNMQDQVNQVQKIITNTDKTSAKLKKELGTVKKKIQTLESGISSAIIEAIEHKIAQELREEQADGKVSFEASNGDSPSTGYQIMLEDLPSKPKRKNSATRDRKRSQTILAPPPTREGLNAQRARRGSVRDPGSSVGTPTRYSEQSNGAVAINQSLEIPNGSMRSSASTPLTGTRNRRPSSGKRPRTRSTVSRDSDQSATTPTSSTNNNSSNSNSSNSNSSSNSSSNSKNLSALPSKPQTPPISSFDSALPYSSPSTPDSPQNKRKSTTKLTPLSTDGNSSLNYSGISSTSSDLTPISKSKDRTAISVTDGDSVAQPSFDGDNQSLSSRTANTMKVHNLEIKN